MVSAINSSTLQLTGTALNKLAAEDITLDGNKVLSITASENGKTATVKLSNALLLDNEYTVKVKIGENTKEIKFTYGFAVTSVSVVESTFDDDTKNQQVGLKVNGQTVDYDTLAAAGYDVNFVAIGSDGLAKNIFNTPSLGLLNDTVAIDDYKIQVTVQKAGSIVVTDEGTIKVRNLELTTTTISDYDVTNSNTAVAVQNSTTLRVNETLTLDAITALSNGEENSIAYSNKITLKSSNPAVISVNADELTANTPGTAVITIGYGDIEKTVTYTVTNAARNFTKAVPAVTSTTVITGAGNAKTISVAAADQFGDYIAGEVITVEVPATGIATAGAATSTTAIQGATGAGKASVVLTGVKNGSGTVLFKNAAGTTLGSLGLKVTDVDNVKNTKLELLKRTSNPAYSTDNALDIAADNLVEYSYNKYTSENVSNGTEALSGGYTVSYNADVVSIGATVDGNGLPLTFTANTGSVTKEAIATSNLIIKGVGVGSTNVAVYDDQGVLVSNFTVTVSNTGYSIKSVAFKSVPTIDYAGKNLSAYDVLTTVQAAQDDIVKNVTLSKSTVHAIRLAESDWNTQGTIAAGDLYIDADGDGAYTAGEVILGKVTAAVVSGATGTLSAGSFNALTGVTTAATDKGTLVFKVENVAGTSVLASTSVTVNVK